MEKEHFRKGQKSADWVPNLPQQAASNGEEVGDIDSLSSEGSHRSHGTGLSGETLVPVPSVQPSPTAMEGVVPSGPNNPQTEQPQRGKHRSSYINIICVSCECNSHGICQLMCSPVSMP
jgi:hypothetical protein